MMRDIDWLVMLTCFGSLVFLGSIWTNGSVVSACPEVIECSKMHATLDHAQQDLNDCEQDLEVMTAKKEVIVDKSGGNFIIGFIIGMLMVAFVLMLFRPTKEVPGKKK